MLTFDFHDRGVSSERPFNIIFTYVHFNREKENIVIEKLQILKKISVTLKQTVKNISN